MYTWTLTATNGYLNPSARWDWFLHLVQCLCLCVAGSYRYRFVELGSFYYWSGRINSLNLVMRGVVHVVKKKSYVEKLTYKVGTTEPKYEPSGELKCFQ